MLLLFVLVCWSQSMWGCSKSGVCAGACRDCLKKCSLHFQLQACGRVCMRPCTCLCTWVHTLGVLQNTNYRCVCVGMCGLGFCVGRRIKGRFVEAIKRTCLVFAVNPCACLSAVWGHHTSCSWACGVAIGCRQP
jgi:hypothetical protein